MPNTLHVEVYNISLKDKFENRKYCNFPEGKTIKPHCYFTSHGSLLTASGREKGALFFLLLCLVFIQWLKEHVSPLSYSVTSCDGYNCTLCKNSCFLFEKDKAVQ